MNTTTATKRAVFSRLGFSRPTGKTIALAALPGLILVLGFVLMSSMMPIYSGLQYLDYDPAYQYLFNGAALMKGYGPTHTDHPGTPVQLLMGVISIISWSIVRLSGLTSQAYPLSVVTHPEEYLRIIMTVFLLMNCVAIYFLGSVVSKYTRIAAAGIACQAGYLLLGVLFPRMFHATPEAVHFLAATSLMITLAPVIFEGQDCSNRRAILVGLFLGLGAASKVTFLPLFFLTLLLRQPQAIFRALSAGFLFTLLLVLPIIDKLKELVTWLLRVATHDGTYGEGKANVIDWTLVPERAALVFAAEPLLIVVAISLFVVILFSRTVEKRTAAIFGLAIGSLLFLTLKHFGIHYLTPAAAIAPAVVIWAVSRFSAPRWLYMIFGAIALVFGIASLQNLSSVFVKERHLRTENETAVNEVIARFKNPVLISAYRSGFRPWAIQFGLASSNIKFARRIPNALSEEDLFYNSNSKSLYRIRSAQVDWSYLEQFEKAGRSVLVVQPRGTRIDQQTVPTETLLDQGFGDTVERIIVTVPDKR